MCGCPWGYWISPRLVPAPGKISHPAASCNAERGDVCHAVGGLLAAPGHHPEDRCRLGRALSRAAASLQLPLLGGVREVAARRLLRDAPHADAALRYSDPPGSGLLHDSANLHVRGTGDLPVQEGKAKEACPTARAAGLLLTNLLS